MKRTPRNRTRNQRPASARLRPQGLTAGRSMGRFTGRPGKRADTSVYERGMTLIELLVATVVLGIITTVVFGTIIYALNSTKVAADGAMSEAELNDAVARFSRDVSAADPILYTSTANGWASNTPANNELWTQTIVNDKCMRTRYWIDDSVATNRLLVSTTQTYANATCPDPLDPDTSTSASSRTIVRALNVVDDAGNPAPLFTYYRKDNSQISAPVGRGDVPKIARVQINVGANVTDRPGGVRLVTSASPRNNTATEAFEIPPPDCGEIGFAVTNPAWSLPPVATWNWAPDATGWTITRAEVVGGVEGPASVVYGPVPASASTPSYSWSDTSVAEASDRTFTYTLEARYLSGTIACPPVTLTRPPEPQPDPSQLTVLVRPSTTSSNPIWPTGVAGSRVELSWTSCTWCRWYQVGYRELDPNSFNPTGGWFWESERSSSSGRTFTHTPGFDRAYEYVVRTRLVANTAESNHAEALTHPAAVSMSGNPLTYRQNRVTWTGSGPSTDGYSVFSRPTYGSTYTTAGNYSASTSSATISAALDSWTNYRVAAYNIGPRGTEFSGSRNVAMWGPSSNNVDLLQYPAIPSVNVEGTETQPDGRYRVTSGTTPTSTSYRFWEYDWNKSASTPNPAAASAAGRAKTGAYTPGDDDGATGDESSTSRTTTAAFNTQASTAQAPNVQAAAAPSSQNPVSTTNSTSTVHTDTTSNPRGSRTWFTTIACNPTGCSENVDNPNLGNFDVGYQRPNTPTGSLTFAPNLYSNDARTAYSRNGDAGESDDKFCNSGACTTNVRKDGSQVGSTTAANADYTYNGNEAYSSDDWGKTYQWTGQSCNPGGCSNFSTNLVESLHFPGPQYWSVENINREVIVRTWGRNDTGNDTTQDRVTPSDVRMSMMPSYGARDTDPYYITRSEVSDDPYNQGESVTINQQRFENRTYGDPDSHHARVAYWTPGAIYQMNVQATAPNGKRRDSPATVQVPPAAQGFNEARAYCRATYTNNTNHRWWKIHHRYKRSGYVPNKRITSPDQNASWTGGNADYLLITEIIGRPNTTGSYTYPPGTSTAQQDHYRWYTEMNYAAYNPWAYANPSGPLNNDNNDNTTSWPDHEWRGNFYAGTNTVNIGNANNGAGLLRGEIQNDEFLLFGDRDDSGGGHRFQQYLYTGSAQMGDWMGALISSNITGEIGNGGAGSASLTCGNGGGSGWKQLGNRMIRMASPGSSAFNSPFTGSGYGSYG